MEKMYLIVGGRCFETRRILKEFKLKGKTARIIGAEDLLLYVEDRQNGDCLYYTGGEKPERIYKKDLHCVVPRIGSGLESYAKAIKHIQNLGIPVTSKSEGLLIAKDKMLTTLKLSEDGIETPKTILYKRPVHFDWVVQKLGNFPIVAKLLSGSRGIGVFILNDRLSASTALETFSSLGHSLQLQAYIESSEVDTNKHDFRLIIIDGVVVCCIKRFSLSGDFRSNASISKQAENHVPSYEMELLALNAAKAVGLSDCCGVDIVERKEDGKLFVIECNGNFGFKNAEKFSKVNVAKKLVEYAIKLANDTTTKNIVASKEVVEAAQQVVNDRSGKYTDSEKTVASFALKYTANTSGQSDTISDNAKNVLSLSIKEDPDNGITFGDFPEDKDNDFEINESLLNVCNKIHQQNNGTKKTGATQNTGAWEGSEAYKDLKQNYLEQEAKRLKREAEEALRSTRYK